MPRFDDTPFDTIAEPLRTLTWEIRRVAVRSTFSDFDLARVPDKAQVRTLLHHAVQENAAACARYVHTELFVGERVEHKTAQVPYEHADTVSGVDYVPVRSWWREMLTMLLLPLVIALEPERVRTPWSRTTVYQGAVPFTYVESHNIDPFIEDHYGPMVRERPTIQAATWDYKNARRVFP